MHITIAERLRPYSHLPGMATLVPGTYYQVRVFPCLIQIYDLRKSSPEFISELYLNLKGPIQQFTIFNDLEKGLLTLSGKAEEGWFRYHLIGCSTAHRIRLKVDRAPHNCLKIVRKGVEHPLMINEEIDITDQEKATSFKPYQIPSVDRLSLGIHKSQDWDLIKRRCDIKEIFPFIHRLGQMIPKIDVIKREEGNLYLLKQCEKSFSEKLPDKGEELWKRFLIGSFHQMLIPRLEDDDHQGLELPPFVNSEAISPLILLSESSRLIRKLFVHQNDKAIFVLPQLFPSLHCGRLINVNLDGGTLSLEWTKKAIRRLILFSYRTQEWNFFFPSNVKTYRLRQNLQEKGVRKSCLESIQLNENTLYLFDNFQ